MSGFIDNLRADNFSMSFGENVLFSDANMSQGAPLAVGGAAMYMFQYCQNLNGNIAIPNSVVNAYSMFYSCSNLNSPVTIDPTHSQINNMQYMFYSCYNFNQDINIPSSARNWQFMFQYDENMNSNIYLHSNCVQYSPSYPEEMGNLNGAFASSLGGNPNVFFMNIEPVNCSFMFQSCSKLNQNIQLPSSISNAVGMFRYCASFNRNIRLPDDVWAGDCFANCLTFNRNIRIPHNASITTMFKNCNNFNQPIHVPVPKGIDTNNQSWNIRGLFDTCMNLNANVAFNSQIKVLNAVFNNCRNFNYNITLPSQVESLPETFSSCWNFNQNIVIPSGVTNMYRTFGQCRNFNQILALPSSLQDMCSTFVGCANFNVNIPIPDSVGNMASTFSGCTNLDQSIHLSSNATILDGTFSTCRNLRSSIAIPSGAHSLIGMFENCNNFNQPVSIPSSVVTMHGMFNNCFNYNQPVTIPNGIVTVNNAFRQCYSMNQHIVIPPSVVNVSGICYGSSVANIDVQCSELNIMQSSGGYGLITANICSLPNFSWIANNMPLINVEGKTPADANFNGGDVVARINFNKDCVIFYEDENHVNWNFTPDEWFFEGSTYRLQYFLGCWSGTINGRSRQLNQPSNYSDYQQNYVNTGYPNVRSLWKDYYDSDNGVCKLFLRDWRNSYYDSELGDYFTPSYPIYFNLV